MRTTLASDQEAPMQIYERSGIFPDRVTVTRIGFPGSSKPDMSAADARVPRGSVIGVRLTNT
jgi:hypothetical protein